MSIDDTRQALRDVPSYAFQVEGYVEAYEEFTGEPGTSLLDPPVETIRLPTQSRGAYVAPDRLTREHDLVSGGDIVQGATRQIGDDVWVRPPGSGRWQLREDLPPLPANPILDIIDRTPNWAIANSDVPTGHCGFVGASADRTGAWTVKVTVPTGSNLPTTVQVTQRFDNPPDWGETMLQTEMYLLQPDAQVAIDPPPTDATSITAADVLSYLEQTSCLNPPCDIGDIQMVYEAHNGALDLFGYERPDRNGYVWFEDGLVATAGSTQSCDPSQWDVSFHTNGEPGDTQWIGGRLTAVAAAVSMRLSDGQVTEHFISSPGYIVPGGTVGGPEVESISIVAPDGEELFHYDMPSPETGISPPPPPDC